MRYVFAALFLLITATAGSAQTFPEYSSTTVNDFADMIDPETEAQLVTQLEGLERDTGVELAVVTLSSVRFYANDMAVADYATALFNNWGIGKEDSNDGMLLLVFRDDRELRIELGGAYGQEWNHAAQQVIDRDILPDFRDSAFSEGISSGVTEMITRISTPFRAGDPAPPEDGNNGIANWWFFGIPAAIAVVFPIISKIKRANERCPNCGAKGLKREKRIITEATSASNGTGETIKTCGSCGHRQVIPFTIAMHTSRTGTSSGSGSFGGGSSGGGGASGRW